MTPIWLEVHVDDVRLAQDPSVWPDVAAHLDGLARTAESGGARLSFRFREWFARGDTHGFVRGLVARGHEAGWHAHAWRLRAARDAVVAAGGDARIASPGLVQARSRAIVLARAWALGARVVTDRPEGALKAYDGWLARSPLPGLTVMDVSLAPPRWGFDFDRLSEIAAVQTAWEAPPGSTPFFGATFHEHDEIRGFERFVGRWGDRIVPSGRSLNRQERQENAEDAKGVQGGAFGAEDLLPQKQLGVLGASSASWRLPLLERLGPPGARTQLVVVHAGESGLAQRLRFLELADDAFGPDVAVWLFARSPDADLAPGNPIHVAETRAVIERAAEHGPVGLLSWSGGVVNALLAADDRVRFLVDVEGPADRHSLLSRPGDALAGLDPFDDAAWAGREAAALVRGFGGAYVRVQSARDHVHGRRDWHARRMVAAARDGRLVRVGRLRSAGATVVALVRELSGG
ncbi:MAG: hypothetical protein ACOZNI_12575 [Myxococcota bacterium]